MNGVRLSEALAAISLTTDLATGVGFEKGLRECAVASALAEAIELPLADQRTVHLGALLRSIGCTSHASENAARALGRARHPGRRPRHAIALAEFERPGGGAYRDEELHLWRLGDDGRVVEFRHYLDTAKHIAAAGGEDTRR